MLVLGAVAGVLVLLVLLSGSSRLRARVQNWQTSPEVVRKATEQLVSHSPGVPAAARFSGSDQTIVEHWDSYRWRVTGYLDSTSESGKTRTLYFAVVQKSAGDWRLEDLQLQNVEMR